jgi:hypothetical protein
MKPTRKLTTDEAFFFRNAGYNHGPGESPAEGRTRCAIALAAAELVFMRSDATCEWVDDVDGAHDAKHDGLKFKTCEGCIIRSADGNVLTSLWSILDAGNKYRRVVRAELASDCLAQLA